jgi:hypothetical protein
MLQKESGLSLSQFVAADNMDLLTVLHEFEQYYSIKFGKSPKLFRRFSGGDNIEEKGSRGVLANRNVGNGRKASPKIPKAAPDTTFTAYQKLHDSPSAVITSPLLNSIQHKVLPKIQSEPDLKKGKSDFIGNSF